MKKILCLAIILASTLNVVFSQDENYYKKYFEEHISELDPIEGIYNVSTHRDILLYGHKVDSVTDFMTCAIVRYLTNRYKVVKLPKKDNKPTKLTFHRIGETNAYELSYSYYETSGAYTGVTKKDRFFLTSPFYFSLGFKLPQDLLDEITHGNLSFEVYDNFEFIKSYPTKTMYDNAIAKRQHSNWSGSSFALGNGYIVTNYHVVEDAKTINVKGIRGDFNNGYSAEVIATDKMNDIAILKINDSQFSGFGTIPYGVSSKMADVGESIFVLGYPLTQTMGDEIKLTDGLISSRTGFQGDIANYQMSAPVQPGNSGGPMFNSKGNVIGIVCAHHAGAENASYAIKISYLKLLIESAGLNITLPNNNTISALSLPEKVKRLKNFVYYIECSK